MRNGFRYGFLRFARGMLQGMSAIVRGRRYRGAIDNEASTEHDMRDLGILDGRVSLGRVCRHGRSGVWRIIEVPHRWL